MRTFIFKRIFVSVLLLVAVTTAFAQPEVDRTGGKEFLTTWRMPIKSLLANSLRSTITRNGN